MSSLIDTARHLAKVRRRRPAQSDLRRAVSTAYYALFDALASTCADELIGSGSAVRYGDDWVRVYRAVSHGTAREACNQVKPQLFGQPVADFCYVFVRLQEERHAADYDPAAGPFRRSDVLVLIDEAAKGLRGSGRPPSRSGGLLRCTCSSGSGRAAARAP